MRLRTYWPLALLAVAVTCLVLRLYQGSQAAPPSGNQPFANAVKQRMEMITELKGVRDLLKEQNALLREQNRLLEAALPSPSGDP